MTSLDFGLDPLGVNTIPDRATMRAHIAMRLAALGLPAREGWIDPALLTAAGDLLVDYQERGRLLERRLCPADNRLQGFLDRTFQAAGIPEPVKLPATTLVLDRHGMARELSLPDRGDSYRNDYGETWRLRQGVVHNTRSDRRTTKGAFHIAESGFPVPPDKLAVPLAVFANLLRLAFAPPPELLRLPCADGDQSQATMVSLLLRPPVRPAVPGRWAEKSLECRCFAPGGLVATLDFLESVFGNAGDPFLPGNDAALDVEGWTGHSGGIVFAPHLLGTAKRAVGLPHVSAANPRQRREGMCWEREDEPYNGGKPFKLTCRTAAGAIVTIIADSYFGYAKKEVKCQISFAANLLGGCEEEHSGGALVSRRNHLGRAFSGEQKIAAGDGQDFGAAVANLGPLIAPQATGHAIDQRYPDIVYVPEDVRIDLDDRSVRWRQDGEARSLQLRAGHTYVLPSGFRVDLEKHPWSGVWRLVGTATETICVHRPCTVSGGGKSELAKSILGSVIYGPIFTNDLAADLAAAAAVIARDYADRLRPELRPAYGPSRPSRPLLSPQRSLGSVIKLLSPSADFTAEYNRWLATIPDRIRAMVFTVKRLHQPAWGDDWRGHFHVDTINGSPGHELKCDGRKLVGSYLRVGREPGGAWRTFTLRQDFIASEKVQLEDDISATTVVPASWVPGLAAPAGASVKLVRNCEQRLFQRPDDAIVPGADAQAEADMAAPGTFCSNYQPLDVAAVRAIVDDVVLRDSYTPPMRELLMSVAAGDSGHVVSSANPRLIAGKPSTNPRYLQNRPDLVAHRARHLVEVCARLRRRLPADRPLLFPVDAVLIGRRNNPPDPAKGITELAVYGPLHYQELPELFIDFIASLSGASPSTTGAGSEGALTKGPFNPLPAIIDLNNALVGFILTGLAGYSTPAGHIGPRLRVDHDITQLMPEVFCRLSPAERDPASLIRAGHLERVGDFSHRGRAVPAGRLGWRITAGFVHAFFGRVFDSPSLVFDDSILRPEQQDPDAFADGIVAIAESERRVAQSYLDDGSIADACPPLQALLRIMATGAWEGKGLDHPEVRALFGRDRLLASDWYRRRLETQQRVDRASWGAHRDRLRALAGDAGGGDPRQRLALADRLAAVERGLATVDDASYLASLIGTFGADPAVLAAAPA